jgi:hypothetical protein
MAGTMANKANEAIAQKMKNEAPSGRGTQITVTPTATIPQAGTGKHLSARDVVMMSFIASSTEITQRILASQERVMLAYLTGTPGQSTPAAVADVLQSVSQLAGIAAHDSFRQVEIETRPQPSHLQPACTVAAGELAGANTSPVLTASGAGAVACADGGSNNNKQSVATVIIAPELEEPVRQEQNSAAPAAAQTEMSADQLIAALIDVVSQRTGYPPEMLDPTLDLEADLGIDSIKRIEILNSFRKLLPESKQLSLESGIEDLAGTKSLQGIMDWIKTEMDSKPGSQEPEANEPALLASRCA